MTHRFSRSPAMRAFAFAALVAMLAPAAHAQIAESALNLDAWTGRPGATTPLTGCIPTVFNAGGLQTRGQDCSVPQAGTATTSNRGIVEAPSAFDPSAPASYQLARLGASSSLGVELHAFAGTGRSFNDSPLAVTAQTSVRYRDYLLLGAVRPASLQLTFHLSGELRIDPAFTGAFNTFQVDAIYGVSAGAGYIASDGAFAAQAPEAYGLVQAHRQLGLPGATPTVVLSGDSYPNQGALTRLETRGPQGGTDVVVTLGADFFNNPVNNLVALELSLATSVHGPAWTFKDLPSGTVLTGREISADFDSTFAMVGLQAFDADGEDITASAGLGLQSLQAVPEPQAWLLLLAGLIVLAWRRRGAVATMDAAYTGAAAQDCRDATRCRLPAVSHRSHRRPPGLAR